MMAPIDAALAMGEVLTNSREARGGSLFDVAQAQLETENTSALRNG
jgi:hypothetical protein